jgi:hypothetical protein
MITLSSLLMARTSPQLLTGAREFLLHFQMPIAFVILAMLMRRQVVAIASGVL